MSHLWQGCRSEKKALGGVLLFFIDESGTDHKKAPYEILGGIGVREQDAWSLICELQQAQLRHFGVELADVGIECKGSQLLKTKVFRNAGRAEKIEEPTKTSLTRNFLLKGQRARETGTSHPMTRDELTSYSQSCIEYARSVFELCEAHQVLTFAIFMHPDAPQPSRDDMLRKDMSSLIKLFWYATEQTSLTEHGLIIFDETENSESKRLVRRMRNYFRRTEVGQRLSGRLLPEPLFVHSDLTTLVQVADLVCYSVNWGYRRAKMDKSVREEMRQFGELAAKLKWRDPEEEVLRSIGYPASGFTYFDDLRPAHERNQKIREQKKKGNALAMPPKQRYSEGIEMSIADEHDLSDEEVEAVR